VALGKRAKLGKQRRRMVATIASACEDRANCSKAADVDALARVSHFEPIRGVICVLTWSVRIWPAKTSSIKPASLWRSLGEWKEPVEVMSGQIRRGLKLGVAPR
jgi:hypothetical protein